MGEPRGESVRRINIGRYEYVRRDYTPKRRGGQAGHGWVRQEPRAEVGAEVRDLVNEVVALRAALRAALTSAHHPGGSDG